MSRSLLAMLALPLVTMLLSSCGGGGDTPSEPAAPVCDEACQDGAAARAMRQTIKLVYNLTLQGKPVGAHDETVDCPLGGKARVFGTATSNAEQGVTDVELTYVLDDCVNFERDDDVEDNYNMVVSGTVVQRGKIAVQPSFTTALSITSDGISLTGTVHTPPIPYQATNCPLVLMQDGNRLFGTMCGRETATTL